LASEIIDVIFRHKLTHMKIGENRLNDSFALGYLMGTIKQVLVYGTVSDESFRALAESIISVMNPDNPYDVEYAKRIKQLADEKGIYLKVEM
jgi:hypothetical protein